MINLLLDILGTVVGYAAAAAAIAILAAVMALLHAIGWTIARSRIYDNARASWLTIAQQPRGQRLPMAFWLWRRPWFRA